MEPRKAADEVIWVRHNPRPPSLRGRLICLSATAVRDVESSLRMIEAVAVTSRSKS